MWITHKRVSPQSYPQLWSKYTSVISWLPTRFHLFSGVIHTIYAQPVDNCGLWLWANRSLGPRGAGTALQYAGRRRTGTAWSK